MKLRSAGAVPGPITRLRRNGYASLAVALVLSLAVFSGGLTEASIVRISGEIDANWHGAYDILVRPTGARIDLEGSQGVVEPNFLAFVGTGGITEAQVEAIRRIPDVELAAPVAFVGYVRYVLTTPAIAIPAPPDKPALFRIVVEASSFDGLTDRLVSRQTARALIGPLQELGDSSQWATTYGDVGDALFADGSLSGEMLSRQALPAIASPVLAVDPEAEMALIGASGSFLAPLEAFGQAGRRTVGNVDLTAIPQQFEWSRSQIQELQVVSDRTRSRPIVPIVVSDSLFSRLRLSLEVTQLGQALDAYPAAGGREERLRAAEAEAGPGERLVGTQEIDASAALRPFQAAQIGFTWPGMPPGEAPGQLIAQFREFEARLTGRPTYSVAPGRPSSTAISLRIEPRGVVGPDQNPAEPISPDADFGTMVAGREMAYRPLTTIRLAVAEGFQPEPGSLDYPFVFAPLSEFDLGSLDLPDNPLNYVPLGAYDPPVTSLVADPTGRPVEPRPLVPTLNPSGLIAVPPLAITDIESATLLRGAAAVDAVRVRVRGVANYSQDSRDRVESVATAIAGLGLDVDIVAGSSPQEVDIFVPGYLADTDPPGDLGWVQQRWTTLGAAERVDRSLGRVSVALLVLSLVAALVVAVGSVLATMTSRLADGSILMSQGWAPGNVRSWFMAEGVVGGFLVGLGGLIAFLAGGRAIGALLAALAMAAAVLGATALGAWVAVRRAASSPGQTSSAGELWLGVPREGTFAVRDLTTYAVRTLMARPARTALVIVATAVGGIAAVLGILILLAVARLTGPTLLAGAVSDAVRPQQLGLLATTGLGCLAFSALLMRQGIRDARADLASLTAAGWSRGGQQSALIRGHVLRMVPTLILVVVGSAALAEPVTASPPLIAALVAVPSVAIITLIGVIATIRTSRSPLRT